MSVSGVNNSSNPYALPDETISVSEAGQLSNQFITLMVAQIQNQDPTNPMDSTQFVEQYATISQVQSLENMTKLQQSSLVLADNLQMLTAASLVGQNVTVHADSLQLDGAVSGQFELQHTSTNTVLWLTDANGVETPVALGRRNAGRVDVALDPATLGLKPGTYQVRIETASGEEPRLQVAGKVNDVRVSDSGPVLNIAGIGSVPFYQIVQFGQRG